MTSIGFYSSSTPITALSPQRFARAKTFLADKGITLVAGSLTGKRDGYRSGTIEARAAELNALIHNPQVEIVMATIGGTNSNALLPYLDYESLNRHPKTFVGYSDATAILLAIKSKAPACRVLYGPALVASFGEFESMVAETWTYFSKIIQTPRGGTVTVTAPKTWTDEALNWNTFERPKQKYPNRWVATQKTKLTGRLMGGNLNTMYGFLASPYFPVLTKNDLLFIEDAEKDAATVEKNFAMLKNAGIFDQVKGIVLGKHALFDDLKTGRQPLEILQEVLGNTSLPIIADYDSCHTIPMMTTPLGSWATFDATKMQVTFSDF
ncbi:S66 peptidase family protein [Pediococcus siamensis]|uniref:S66 family peptidase n=1 Tax=Pediococcus siamensis TaxID=381829 RepID=UPI0039A037A5